jgi:hypothetical protein
LKKGVPTALAGDALVHCRYPHGKDVELRTVRLPKDKEKKQDSPLPLLRLELLLAGQQPKVLVSGIEAMTATPSPDGEWVALRCPLPKENPMAPQKERMLLVNRKGEVVEVGTAN